MGFDVRVVIEGKRPPDEALMKVLNDQFEEATHEPHSKTVVLREHVAVSNEADAVAFVRGLITELIPASSTITEVSVISD
ncbi:MAG: hypothetical protein WD023_00845 [Ilumatobacteraceae bacterium]